MNRILGLLGASLALSWSGAADDSEWSSLLDGKRLAEWTNAAGGEPGTGWRLEDGILHRKGPGGDLVSRQEFGDFEFAFEWKLAAGSNSGVKYRVQRFGPRGLLGPEYQVLDDSKHPDGHREITSTASIYALVPPAEEKPLRPVGEWNQSRIVARGTKLEHWLNGEKVAEADTSSPQWKTAVGASKFRDVEGFGQNPKGRLLLQDHGDAVWYRNLRIRVLD